MIDDHNAKHGLNAYDNRRKDRKIEDEISLLKSIEFNLPDTPIIEPVTEEVQPVVRQEKPVF